MPQHAFIQVMAAAATLSIIGVVVAIPVGRRAGSRAGRTLLRGSVLAMVAVLAACLVWGQASGDLERFNTRMGWEAWLQIAMFFALILSTGYRFVGRYLDDRAEAEREVTADA